MSSLNMIFLFEFTLQYRYIKLASNATVHYLLMPQTPCVIWDRSLPCPGPGPSARRTRPSGAPRGRRRTRRRSTTRGSRRCGTRSRRRRSRTSGTFSKSGPSFFLRIFVVCTKNFVVTLYRIIGDFRKRSFFSVLNELYLLNLE